MSPLHLIILIRAKYPHTVNVQKYLDYLVEKEFLEKDYCTLTAKSKELLTKVEELLNVG
jgi:predicted transcriptional regulator